MKRRSDFVEWRRFETVRGNSKRIPQLMGRLATNEGPEEALTTLEDELFHQGWRPSAAKPAITALVDLLPTTDLKAEVLYLLSCLAIGFDDHCLGPQGIEGSHYYDQELYSEAGRTFKDLVPFLESGSVEIRMGACLCLAWFPDLSEATLPLIRQMTSSSSESEVVVSLVTRGLLKDNVGLMRDGSKRMLYASNCAYCEAHPVGDENLEIFFGYVQLEVSVSSIRARRFRQRPFRFQPWRVCFIRVEQSRATSYSVFPRERRSKPVSHTC